MSRNPLQLLTGAVLAVALGSACSAAQAPPPGSSEVLAPEPSVEVDALPANDPDPTGRERWESPFAVSGVGRAVVRPPRDILVLGADSAIAEGLARQEAAVRPGSVAARTEAGPRTEPTSAAAGPNARNQPVSAPAESVRGTEPVPAPTESATRTGPAAAATGPASTSGRAPVTLLGEEASETAASTRATGSTRAPGGGATEGARLSVTADVPGERMALHVVEVGENWSRIVVRYGVSSQALAAANPGVEPNLIRTGQILNIPIPASSPASRSHRVGPGETLRGIATRYNVTADEIRRLNAMGDERVTMGETLLIPAARGAEGDGR